MSENSKVTPAHRQRAAVVYVRQSPLLQLERNKESTARQYDLVERAVVLGWSRAAIGVVDEDQGHCGSSTAGRSGFAELAARIGLGQVGIVLALEVSRLARNNADWYRLLGAPRSTTDSCGDGRAPPPGRRSGRVKLEAV
ncbi:recombinase family protein [Streptomyces sp. NPDC050743]|uniref:recombinase family protein n=1 Tax=Streptomyces sp. NPDC050743 TaxID=3365634 RepID=UPI0037917E04